MLHFRKMTLRDFGPYKGEQVIDFSDQSGVTIFGAIMDAVKRRC